MHIQYPRIPSAERLQNCLYWGWWHLLAGCQTKSFRSEESFESLFPEPLSVWLMAKVCALPLNEQRIWFGNLQVIAGVKEMTGNLMVIPDMDHLLQGPGQRQSGHSLGSHLHTWQQEICALFWCWTPPGLGAKHLTSLPREPEGAALSRLVQNTLTPAVEIWKSGFPTTTKHRTYSSGKKKQAKSKCFTSKESWNSELVLPLIFHITNATNSFFNSHASLFSGECVGNEVVCRSFQAAY